MSENSTHCNVTKLISVILCGLRTEMASGRDHEWRKLHEQLFSSTVTQHLRYCAYTYSSGSFLRTSSEALDKSRQVWVTGWHCCSMWWCSVRWRLSMVLKRERAFERKKAVCDAGFWLWCYPFTPDSTCLLLKVAPGNSDWEELVPNCFFFCLDAQNDTLPTQQGCLRCV